MNTRLRSSTKIRSAFAGLAILLLGSLTQAKSLDQNDARRLREAGKIRPLPVILHAARATRPGRVLEVELECEHKRVIYEVEVIDRHGRLWKLRIDAATAKVLSTKREERHANSGRRR
ncbi:MAG TPA: PepSY domain-containing protein [Nitrococcus sp.]|nr:PepSY domain-containing protein [Nitrococcus sp.]